MEGISRITHQTMETISDERRKFQTLPLNRPQTGEYLLRDNASRIECSEIEETHLIFNTYSERYAQQSSSHFLAKYPASSLTKSSLLHIRLK
jgi:hypothetical protein